MSFRDYCPAHRWPHPQPFDLAQAMGGGASQNGHLRICRSICRRTSRDTGPTPFCQPALRLSHPANLPLLLFLIYFY